MVQVHPHNCDGQILSTSLYFEIFWRWDRRVWMSWEPQFGWHAALATSICGPGKTLQVGSSLGVDWVRIPSYEKDTKRWGETTSHYICSPYMLRLSFFLNTLFFCFLRVAPSTVDSLVLHVQLFQPSNHIKNRQRMAWNHWLRSDTQPAVESGAPFSPAAYDLETCQCPWVKLDVLPLFCWNMQYYAVLYYYIYIVIEITRFCVLLALTGICVFFCVCLWRLWCCCCYCCVFCVKSLNSFSCLDCCF